MIVLLQENWAMIIMCGLLKPMEVLALLMVELLLDGV